MLKRVILCRFYNTSFAYTQQSRIFLLLALELSVAEQSYGNFLSNMKSNYDSLNERSRRTKQEIHDVRRRLLEPAVCDTITCRDVSCGCS